MFTAELEASSVAAPIIIEDMAAHLAGTQPDVGVAALARIVSETGAVLADPHFRTDTPVPVTACCRYPALP